MLPVRVRSAVASAPAYVAGRRPTHAGRVARLASNELSFDVPLTTRSRPLRRYPEPTSGDLRQALADRFGLAADAIVASPGSVALCRLLIDTVCDPGDEVVFGWRSFEAYRMLTVTAGATPVAVPLTASGEHDLPAMAAAVTDRTRLIFVCSPNNPTGTVVSPAAFDAFLAAVPADVLVVLDEAYIEFVTVPVPDAFHLLASHPNVLVLRTFSKAYGLAGARVGYGVCAPSLAALLREVQVPFAVAQPSIELAIAALRMDLADRLADIVARREALVALLADRGLRVPTAQGNFVWLPVGNQAAPLAAALADRDVLVRPFAGEGIRITVGDEHDMRMLTAALDDVLVGA